MLRVQHLVGFAHSISMFLKQFRDIRLGIVRFSYAISRLPLFSYCTTIEKRNSFNMISTPELQHESTNNYKPSLITFADDCKTKLKKCDECIR